MWRLIVSPEDAPRLDLETHARDLVASMERDLETRLEWIGIDHNNTDNPHVHILIRGRDEHGQKLEIAREYVKLGIRARSQEIVQRELGLRPEREVIAAREKVIDQRRWTDLDWSIKQEAAEIRGSHTTAIGTRSVSGSANATARKCAAFALWNGSDWRRNGAR